MNLIEAKTGKRLAGKIDLISSDELADINGGVNFHFKWKKGPHHKVYSLKLTETGEILGLISIADYHKELRLHIHLIESSVKCRGKNKAIVNVPGCLNSLCLPPFFQKRIRWVCIINSKNTADRLLH